MKFIKNNKGAILLYLVIMTGAILLMISNKKYEQQKIENADKEYVFVEKK